MYFKFKEGRKEEIGLWGWEMGGGEGGSYWGKRGKQGFKCKECKERTCFRRGGGARMVV